MSVENVTLRFSSNWFDCEVTKECENGIVFAVFSADDFWRVEEFARRNGFELSNVNFGVVLGFVVPDVVYATDGVYLVPSDDMESGKAQFIKLRNKNGQEEEK